MYMPMTGEELDELLTGMEGDFEEITKRYLEVAQ